MPSPAISQITDVGSSTLLTTSDSGIMESSKTRPSPTRFSPGDDTTASFRTRTPASFKSLLGRIRARASAPRRTNQAPHEPKNQAEGPGKEDAQKRTLIGTRRDQNRAHEPDDEGDRAHEQCVSFRTLTPPPPASDGAVPEDCPESREWYEGYDQAHGVTRDCGMRPNGSRLSCGANARRRKEPRTAPSASW